MVKKPSATPQLDLCLKLRQGIRILLYVKETACNILRDLISRNEI